MDIVVQDILLTWLLLAFSSSANTLLFHIDSDWGSGEGDKGLGGELGQWQVLCARHCRRRHTNIMTLDEVVRFVQSWWYLDTKAGGCCFLSLINFLFLACFGFLVISFSGGLVSFWRCWLMGYEYCIMNKRCEVDM